MSIITINRLPLFSVFPVSSWPHSVREIQFANYGIETLRQIKNYNSEMDMVHALIESSGCGEPNSIMDDALNKCGLYKSWQAKMPALKDVPCIHKYRIDSINDDLLQGVNEEILQFGGFLPPGQILYRGAIFNSSDFEVKNGPISTSTHPRVAWWHAKEVAGSIGVMRIADAAEIRAFIFKTSGNQKHTSEYEVLLQNDLSLQFIDTHQHDNMHIFEYEVSNA